MKHEKQVWEKSRMELFRGLGCQESGLTQADAKSRLEKYGVNELHAGKQKSVLQIFLGQFADFLVLILILAAVISACMGDVESMIVILTVITMNAILGTVQTVKAAASLDSLKQMSAPTAKVLRDGQIVQIPGREVVPGNVVILEAGDSVCADGRLLECASLKCAESALTGESLPVEKDTDEISGETALGDRKNMVFSGSFVTYGRGRFLVTATGMDTEMGKIVLLLKSTEERKTPLQVSLDQFGKKLSIIIMPEERKNIEQVNEQFSNEGLRVLAFACRRVDSTAVSLEDSLDAEKVMSDDSLALEGDMAAIAAGEDVATTASDYFAAVRLSRQQARDNAVNLLQEAMAYADTTTGSKELESAASLDDIVQTALSEAQIESLVIAKGYADCVAYMSGDGISVAVSSPEGGLQQADVAVIADIVMSQSDYALGDIRVVEVQ